MPDAARAPRPPRSSRRRRWRLPRLWPGSLAGQTVLVLLVGLTLSHLLSLGLYSIDRARLLQIVGGWVLVGRVSDAVERLEATPSPLASRTLLRAMSDPRMKMRVSPAPMVPDTTGLIDNGRAGEDGDDDPIPMSRFLMRALDEALADIDAESGADIDGTADAAALEPRPVRIARAENVFPLPDPAPSLTQMPQNGRETGPEDVTPGPWHGWRGTPGWGGPMMDDDGPDHPFGHWRRFRDSDSFPAHLHRWVIGDPLDRKLAISVGLRDGRWLNVIARIPEPQGFWTPGALASIVLMGLVILALSLWAVRRLTRPLRAVAAAARRMGQDPRVDPLPESGSRELRAVAAAFNDMQERLARLVDNRTRLLAAISHDLRTPITTLRLRAEFVEDPEERTRMLATLDDMEAMLRATLDFARDDVTTEETRSLDLRALVEAICDDLAETGRDVAVSEDGPAALAVRGRASALRRAVTNLVQNACVYAGAARVAVEDGPGSWAVVVTDDGPGIAEEHLARVTDPFYRVEGSRARETGGIGLGLSIVQAVADAHGGRLILRNRPEGGLEARLEGPRETPRRGVGT